MNKEELREYCRVASKQIITLEEKNKKLQQENQQLKEQLEASERARKEANKIILECLLSEEYNTLNSDYLSIVFFKLTKVLNLDIDKGE